jgi:hypothetical protein
MSFVKCVIFIRTLRRIGFTSRMFSLGDREKVSCTNTMKFRVKWERNYCEEKHTKNGIYSD